MRTRIGQVVVTEPRLARRVDRFIWIGQGFALADAAEFESAERHWMEQKYGAKPDGRYTLPLSCAEPIKLPGLEVAPVAVPRLRVSCITSDKMLYRRGRDVVHLLVLDALGPISQREIVISEWGRSVARRTLCLDASGIATLELADLPAGEYTVSWSTAPAEEPACEFVVAEYGLAPLAASLVHRMLDEARLSFEISLDAFGLPVNGRVRLELTDRGDSVACTTAVAKEGRVVGSFLLTGKGPHAIQVQMLDDPARTATVPIIGSRAADRQSTILSRLGTVVTASLLPGNAARAVRGIYLDEQGFAATPVQLEQVDSRVVRLRVTQKTQAVSAQLINLATASTDTLPEVVVAHRDAAAPGEVIEIENPWPLALVGVAAFVNDTPWEGWAAAVRPSELQPRICTPKNLAAGTDATIEVVAGHDASRVYLVVKDARLPAADAPASRLAGQIKRSIDEFAAHSEHHSLRAASMMRDWTSILLYEGAISREQLDDAAQLARQRSIDLAHALRLLDYATEKEICKAVAQQHHCEYVDLEKLAIPPAILALV